MKLVPFEAEDGEESEVSIPEVPAACYGELFRAADWVVLNRPWEQEGVDPLFEMKDLNGGASWQATVAQNEVGLCLFSLVRKDGEQLEVQFLGSDFLQGHDYDLNVRFAPDSWDECERDVIVLRARRGEEEPGHPTLEEVRLLAAGLTQLETFWEAL